MQTMLNNTINTQTPRNKRTHSSALLLFQTSYNVQQIFPIS